MTEKKPRTRTLKSGEKVIVLEDGVKQMIAANSLANTLMATDNAMREEDAAKTAARLEAIQVKRDSLDAGDAVPDDKRVV